MAASVRTTPAQLLVEERDAFGERVLESLRGAFDVFALYLGVRLGLYDALAQGSALDSAELASRTGTDERYVREWLEQQTVTGVVRVDDPHASADRRRYRLPAGHAEVLAERDSLDYKAPFARLFVGAVHPLPAILAAFRTGAGIPFDAYGDDLREGQGAVNRAAFLQELGSRWLPAIPDVHQRLLSEPGARVADIGCGVGWSSIGLARSYPRIALDGFDLDRPSIERARLHAREAGLADRVRFQVRDAADPRLTGDYDVVMALECLHDVSNPVGVLEAMARLVRPGGAVLVVDERVEDGFCPDASDYEWMMYGWSVFHCLPAGRAARTSEATGTVMRCGTLTDYALRAGFGRVEVLPIEDAFFRFYRLHR